jgi:hypothetical protein
VPQETSTWCCQLTFKGVETSSKEDKKRLCGNPRHQKESASRYGQHQERAEVMIVSLTGERTSFFHAEGGYPTSLRWSNDPSTRVAVTFREKVPNSKLGSVRWSAMPRSCRLSTSRSYPIHQKRLTSTPAVGTARRALFPYGCRQQLIFLTSY